MIMQQYLAALGLSLIFAGLALALIAVILLLRRGRFRGSGGAVILIGPIPIILGSNRRVTLIMLAFTIIFLLIFAIGYFAPGR